jgi:hypothetical protein
MKITWDLPRIRVNSIYLVHVVEAVRKDRKGEATGRHRRKNVYLCFSPRFLYRFNKLSGGERGEEVPSQMLHVSILSDEVSLIQPRPRTMKFEKRHKNKYHVIIRFIKLLHHQPDERALAYLWFFVEGSMVCVVRRKRTLLHMPMVKQVIIFEASDLEMRGNKSRLILFVGMGEVWKRFYLLGQASARHLIDESFGDKRGTPSSTLLNLIYSALSSGMNSICLHFFSNKP